MQNFFKLQNWLLHPDTNSQFFYSCQNILRPTIYFVKLLAYLEFLKCVRRALHSIICKCFVRNITDQKIRSGANTIHFIDLSYMQKKLIVKYTYIQRVIQMMPECPEFVLNCLTFTTVKLSLLSISSQYL